MGERATIRVALENNGIESAVHFYTHWEGHMIWQILADGVLKANELGRLDDSSYATRIIFDNLTGCEGLSTGYGIIPGDDNIPQDIEYDIPCIKWVDWSWPVVFNWSRSGAKECDALVWAESYNKIQ